MRGENSFRQVQYSAVSSKAAASDASSIVLTIPYTVKKTAAEFFANGFNAIIEHVFLLQSKHTNIGAMLQKLTLPHTIHNTAPICCVCLLIATISDIIDLIMLPNSEAVHFVTIANH